MDIPIISGIDIDINDINIGELRTYQYTPPSVPVAAPVTVDIGVPVVNIPGCVEAHETNNSKNDQVKSDDKRGLVTFCDSGIPSFDAIQYEPDQMIMTYPAVVPKTDSPDKPTPPEAPKTPTPKTPVATAKVDCPTPGQEAKEPVGTLIEGFRKKVVAYELVGNECIQRTESVALPRQIIAGLPSGGQVMQVGGIAVIATSSALLAKPLADILLKAVKPAVKKVMKKIAAIRGKKPPILSVKERQDEQRQMNAAVKALRSVFPRKKKRKG